ncbi:MAG: hypothetical protein FWG84_07090 [Bacteroidales bacterium]|nr:hypothetical protein [Bacteroidales bacterium]
MAREILLGCCLFLLSAFAVPNLFVSKKKEISAFYKKLILYQGLVGLVACVLGAIALFQSTLKIAAEGKPILWLTEMLCTAALAVIGFLLCYNLIYTLFLAKGEKTEESRKKMLTGIMPLQGKIGLLGVAVGIWSVMAAVMFA